MKPKTIEKYFRVKKLMARTGMPKAQALKTIGMSPAWFSKIKKQMGEMDAGI